jgi:hypothetical protein
MRVNERCCANCEYWWYRLKERYVTGKGECRNEGFNSMPHEGENAETRESWCCCYWEKIKNELPRLQA